MAPAIDKEEVTRIIKLVSSFGHEEAALPETQTSPRRTSVDSNAPFIVIPIPLMPPSQHNPLDDSPQNQDELGLGNKFRNFYLSESHDQGNSRGSKTASSSSSPSHVLVDKITRVLSTLQENRKIPDLAAVTSDLTSQEAILAIKVLPHIGFENDERVMDALNCLRRRIDSSKEDLAIGELTINNAPVVPELPKLAAPFERVGSNFTITIVESEIDGAGKGLTVKEAVPANTVVFAIGKPTIHVVRSLLTSQQQLDTRRVPDLPRQFHHSAPYFQICTIQRLIYTRSPAQRRICRSAASIAWRISLLPLSVASVLLHVLPLHSIHLLMMNSTKSLLRSSVARAVRCFSIAPARILTR